MIKNFNVFIIKEKINIPEPILISAGITGSGLGEKLDPVGLQDIMKAAKIKRKFLKLISFFTNGLLL